MKSSKSKIILVIIVIYFIVMGYKNIMFQKDYNKDILNKVTYVTNGKIKSENDGKLVIVTGKISYDDKIKFQELDEEIDSFYCKRTVEVYTKNIDSNKKTHFEWAEIMNKCFNECPYTGIESLDTRTIVNDALIGEFNINEDVMKLIKTDMLYRKQKNIENFEFDGLYYSELSHEDNPVVGDKRISYNCFDTNKTKYLSVLGVQKGNSFKPYKVDNKTNVLHVFKGKIDTKEKLEKALDKNVKTNIKGKSLFVILILLIGIVLIIDNKKQK